MYNVQSKARRRAEIHPAPPCPRKDGSRSEEYPRPPEYTGQGRMQAEAAENLREAIAHGMERHR